MNRLFTVFTLFVTLPAFAQITVTDKHMPKSGDTIRYSIAASLGKTDVVKSGANQTWDFTDLTFISQGLAEYKASYQTPYIINFGFTALGMKLLDTLGTADFQLQNVYNFYRNTTASFTDVGIGFQFGAFPLPQSGKHSDPDEVYTFPLKYGNKDTTTFSLKVPIMLAIVPVGTFFRSGTRINIVDGWGKISTPYAKDVQCLRIRTVINEYDSISVSTLGLNFGTSTQRVEYKWVAMTEKIPMLVATGTEALGTFTAVNIQYRDSSRQTSPPENISVDFTVDKTTSQKDLVLNFTNNSQGNNLSYTWQISPSNNVLYVNGTSSSSEHPRVIFTDTGFYSVKLIATGITRKDSLVKSNYIHITTSLGATNLGLTSFKIFPNPAKHTLTLQAPNSKQAYTTVISDVHGRVHNESNHIGNDFINTSQLAVGSYVLSIFDEMNNMLFRQMLFIGE